MHIYQIQPPIAQNQNQNQNQNQAQFSINQPNFTLVRGEKGSLLAVIIGYRRNNDAVSFIVDTNGKVYRANSILARGPYIICAVATKDQPLTDAQMQAINALKTYLNAQNV